MTAQERKQKLKELQESTTPAIIGLPLKYQGENKTFNAYRIPLDYLVYNPYNGRIGSIVKSYERQNHKLDVENPDDVKLIEQFLWQSKIDANKKTRQSLLDDHQQKFGIVTAEGVIIDGNRRASLLNNIRHDDSIPANRKGHCEYFTAIILPGDADKKEILRLETTFQMGEDAKVDYNPIEKYLKCKDLKDAGFTDAEIADFMGESKSNVSMYLAVLQLMDQYLEYYNYTGIYTLLDKNEDSFQKLNSALKSYRSGSVPCMWDFDPEEDTEDLKLIAFDYIRCDFDQTAFRDIIRKPTSQNPNASIFGNKEIWTSFKERHFDNVEKITNEEENVESLIQHSAGNDITRILRARDNKWRRAVEPIIKENFSQSIEKLHNKQAADNPLKLLQKALDALESVDTEQESFKHDANVLKCIDKISQIAYDYKKLLE